MAVAREAKAWRTVQLGPPLPAAAKGLVKPGSPLAVAAEGLGKPGPPLPAALDGPVKPGPPLPAALDGPVQPGPPLLRVNSRILVFFLRWGWSGFHAAPDRGKRGWSGFHAATDRGKRGWCGFHAAPDGGGWCGGLPRERRVNCRGQSYSVGSQSDRGKVLVASAWTVMRERPGKRGAVQ